MLVASCAFIAWLFYQFLLPLPGADHATRRGTVESILDKRRGTSDGTAERGTAFRAKNRKPFNPRRMGVWCVSRKGFGLSLKAMIRAQRVVFSSCCGLCKGVLEAKQQQLGVSAAALVRPCYDRLMPWMASTSPQGWVH